MCDHCNGLEKYLEDKSENKSKRLWLWEFTDNVHCPLIGTCLTTQDLLNLTRKLKLQVSNECQDYDLHCYFVTATNKKCKEAKAIHKLLDDRHSGALRQFRRLTSQEEILEHWYKMKNAGHIAGAFYALMTLRHIPLEVRGIVFGEVHMLSHLMGASFREKTLELAVLRSRLNELNHRKNRVETGLHDALEQRDDEIANLKAELSELRGKVNEPQPAKQKRPVDWRSSKYRRAVEIARSKAKAAELVSERLEKKNAEYRKQLHKLKIVAASVGEVDVDDDKLNIRHDGKAILYVGGRPSQIFHLEKTADLFGVKFIHHDGGKEDLVTRIDDVLPSVDCVFCPVNCVSHDACLRVKAGCKKLGKTFVPLRNSSQSSFRNAILELDQEMPNA